MRAERAREFFGSVLPVVSDVPCGVLRLVMMLVMVMTLMLR